jgi:hypothetical protein
LLKRFAADVDLASPTPYRPGRAPLSGHRVAVVGAGPAGLSALYYLQMAGHACVLFEAADAAGGQLRLGVDREHLPLSVLAAEIGLIVAPETEFRPGVRLGDDVVLADLRREFGAVIVATGEAVPGGPAGSFGLATSGRGIKVAGKTLQTSMPGVFAAGGAVTPGRLAVRAVAQGKAAAHAVSQFLQGMPVTGPLPRFNSTMGTLQADELEQLGQGADTRERMEPAGGLQAGFTRDEAVTEARRCLRCDCRKAHTCRLREYAEQYGASQHRYKGAARPPFRQIRQHAGVVYEPGKCIKCGRCVRITRKAGERLGLTFVGRGFDVRIGVPFERPLGEALEKAAEEVVDACPTAALARP